MTLSRRRFLHRSAALFGGVGLAGVIAVRAEAKIKPALVNYQDTPHGPQRCDNCKLFEAPNACKSVDGTISPSGWCKLWLKA